MNVGLAGRGSSALFFFLEVQELTTADLLGRGAALPKVNMAAPYRPVIWEYIQML